MSTNKSRITSNVLQPGEYFSVRHSNVDGGRKSAVDAGRDDEVLLVVRVATGRALEHAHDGRTRITFASILDLFN